LPGPYAFEIRVPPRTGIAAHQHRDDRTALAVSGEWHFGYGTVANEKATRTLGPGAFYTEPAGDLHFAFTAIFPLSSTSRVKARRIRRMSLRSSRRPRDRRAESPPIFCCRRFLRP
jgi:uncharacterized RmlC-like cupin family protein